VKFQFLRAKKRVSKITGLGLIWQKECPNNFKISQIGGGALPFLYGYSFHSCDGKVSRFRTSRSWQAPNFRTVRHNFKNSVNVLPFQVSSLINVKSKNIHCQCNLLQADSFISIAIFGRKKHCLKTSLRFLNYKKVKNQRT